MANSRSFTEYVKNKLDNHLWAALEDYLRTVNVSLLDLRLYTIRNIGEIELYDTDVQFVNVFNLPGTKIRFEVVLDATLEVYDSDLYHNDKSESQHQWFMLKCEGDLADNLANITICDVDVYFSRNKQTKAMSDSLVPIIYKEQLETEATNFIKKFYPEALQEPIWIDPSELARRMNLTIQQQRITKELDVFGQIFFRDCKAKIYDEAVSETKTIDVERGTILVDPQVAFQRNLGAFHNTIVHECVHWEFHQKAFDLERLFNEEASQIKCKVVGGIQGKSNEATKWMEWQANALAPRIQMPLIPFKKKVTELIRQYRDKLGVFEICELIPFVIEDLAMFFVVSRTAAKLRMIDAGYEEAAGAFTYIDGCYVKPHSYKKGALKHNQTYSIPAKDAAIQSILNANLKDSKNYIYIDSHFVLNHPRYVYRDNNDMTLMTDYARYHMDECCLAFDLSITGKIDNSYHRECFLNRDKESPITFDFVYSGDNKELDDENRKKLLRDEVMEEARFLDSLPNNYTSAWKAVLKWRGVSQAELSRRTNITDKTIGHIINCDTAGTLNNIVLMCLALNLPWDISNYLLERSPHNLTLQNDNHNWYRFTLQRMYTKSIDEIQKFLQAQGANPL